MNKITRFELIVDGERKVVLLWHTKCLGGDHNVKKIEYDLQDNNQTMKVFIN